MSCNSGELQLGCYPSPTPERRDCYAAQLYVAGPRATFEGTEGAPGIFLDVPTP